MWDKDQAQKIYDALDGMEVRGRVIRTAFTGRKTPLQPKNAKQAKRLKRKANKKKKKRKKRRKEAIKAEREEREAEKKWKKEHRLLKWKAENVKKVVKVTAADLKVIRKKKRSKVQVHEEYDPQSVSKVAKAEVKDV